MPLEVTYSEARARLASLWDEATSTREPILIRRRGKESMAMIPAEEYAALLETAHLMRSPKNLERLLTALGRAKRGKGRPESVESLREELGL